MKILTLVAKRFEYDPRAYRAAVTLSKEGFDLEVACFVFHKAAEKRTVNNIEVSEFELAKITRSIKRLIKAKKPSSHEQADQTFLEDSKPNNRMKIIKNTVGALLFFVQQARFSLFSYWNVRKKKADIYYAHDLETLLTAKLAARKHKGSVVYDAHELYPELYGENNPYLQKLILWYEKKLTSRVKALITVNQSIADLIQQRYGTAQVSVVRNIPLMQKNSLPVVLSEKSSDNVNVIFQGALHKDRGLEEIILSMAYVEGAHLYIRGDGPIKQDLMQLAKESFLESKVSFLEPVDPLELVGSLVNMDIGICPYVPTNLNQRLCLPNKLFEYMHAGLAICASDLPELRKIINENRLGSFFNPYSKESIATALNTLITDNEALNGFKINSLNTSEIVNWDNEKKQLIAVFKGVNEDFFKKN